MTRRLILTALAIVFASTASTANAISVNLGLPGSPTETGFTNHFVANGVTPATANIDGVDISVTSSTTFRSINRSDGYNGPLDNLTQSWWGNSSTTVGGAVLTITLDGSQLGAGQYNWTSWHHDHSNQTGPMRIEFAEDGVTFVTKFASFDIVDGALDLDVGAPNPASFTFFSNGIDDVAIRLTNLSGAGANNFTLINGFEATPVPPPIPEPSTALLLGAGLLGIRRRIRRRSKA